MKKLFALALSIVILLSSVSLVASAATNYAGSDYTSNAELAAKLDNLLNGKAAIFLYTDQKFKVGDVFPQNKFYWKNDNGYQCYAYANASYYYLFGDSPKHGDSKYTKSKIVDGVKGKNQLSYDIFTKAGIGCGAWLRTTANSSGAYHSSKAHSVIILSYDKKQVTYLHAARKVAKGPYYIQLTTQTWKDFNYYLFTYSGKRYVCAMLQPNLTAGGVLDPSYASVYKTIRKCKLYTGPGISNKKAGSKKKGAIIIVESGVTNEYGNLWYKTVDGKYIYSGDVEKVNLTETQASGTFRFKKDDESREWPYEAAKLIKKYTKGTDVQVCAKVVNTYGNTWYKLTEGGYVWEGDLEQQVTLSELEFKNVVYPSVFRISASGWYLSSGELTSNYELTSITSEIRKGDSTTVSKATKTISGKSFSIKNLDDLSASSNDNGVRFSYIYSKGYGEGSYTWRLTATDASGAELALVMPFTATNSGGGMENIASIKYGDNKAKIKSAPVTGDTVKDSGGKYRINNETMTAEYVEPTKKKISSVEIPATIEVAGGVYKVTAIGSRAFAGLENLTSVTIGKNVEKIGKKAFYKCLNLDRIKIKSKKLTADMIGKDAFKGISEKATISCPDELMKAYRKMILKNGASKSVTFK